MQTRIVAHATTLCGTVTGVLQLIMIAIMLTDAAQGTYMVHCLYSITYAVAIATLHACMAILYCIYSIASYICKHDV